MNTGRDVNEVRCTKEEQEEEGGSYRSEFDNELLFRTGIENFDIFDSHRSQITPLLSDYDLIYLFIEDHDCTVKENYLECRIPVEKS